MVILESGDFGSDYILRDEETDATILIQTDWDYPGVAKYLGWSPSKVAGGDDQPLMHSHMFEESCPHDGTDGTIDCPDCGVKAGDFIASAREWLDDHIGEGFEDPGYFSA
jgi:hypothetical protein